MLFRIDPAAPQPLHAQIAANVRRALIDGTLTPGERLPAARDLATSLEVNMHTVLRAYATLRDEGIVELRRGRGAIVTGTSPGDAEISSLIATLIEAGQRHGLTPADLSRRIGEQP